MTEEIIDDITEETVDNSKLIWKIVWLAIVSIAVFLTLIFIRANTLVYTIPLGDSEIPINIHGIIFLAIVFLISRLLLKLLVKIQTPLSIYRIVACTGVFFFLIEFIYMCIQNIVIYDYGFDLDYLGILKISGIISLIGMLSVNIGIHRIRQKEIQKPILLLIGVWMLIGYVFQMYNN